MRYLLPIAIALVGGGLLAWACVTRNAPRIEDALAREGNAALVKAGILEVVLTMDGRDATLTGTVKNDPARAQRAVDVVGVVYGMLSVTDSIERASSDASELVVRLTRSGNGVLVSGLVAQGERESIKRGVRDWFGSSEGTFRSADIEASSLAEPVLATLPFLRQLDDGFLEVTTTQTTLRGTPPNAAFAAYAHSAISAGLPPEQELILRLDRAWTTADHRLTARGTEIGGVTDQATLDALAELGADFSEVIVIDAPAPEGFGEAFAVAYPQLTAESWLVESAEETKVVWISENPRTFQQGPNHSMHLVALPPLDPRLCDASIDQLVAGTPITFRSGSAKLSASGAVLTERISEVMHRCPTASIHVEGHTDATGSASENLSLSMARAATVATELVANGIEPRRLTTAGQGASKPIADNGTDAGRAKNRRIEFELQGAPP